MLLPELAATSTSSLQASAVETAGCSLEETAVAFGDKAFADSDEEVMESATKGDEKMLA
jgi:hypothetical protein